MNKQGPGKIDWTDYTWNPISGCYHNCYYCYMNRMEKRFKGIMEYKFHPDRINAPSTLKKPSKIFTGSSGDMWGDWVEKNHLQQVLDVVLDCPQHTFQFLTKNPSEYLEWDFSGFKNIWIGTTVDGLPHTKDNLDVLKTVEAPIRFISFEPLLMPIDPDLNGINWVIIGADSSKCANPPPSEWAKMIIENAREAGCGVWVKENYTECRNKPKEFPK